jgi:hypothetical protein
MTLEEAVAAIRKWKDESLRGDAVAFRETVLAERAEPEDYTVAYEAVFESEDLRKARLELWVTDIGHVSIGFEKHHRLARRLGYRPRGRSTFLSGHEPAALSEDAVREILDAVSKGRIHVTYVNLFGLS